MRARFAASPLPRAARRLAFAFILIGPAGALSGAEPEGSPPGMVRVPRPSHPGPRAVPGAAVDPGARPTGSGGWWIGSAGVAVVLTACGVLCLAARRYGAQGSSGLVRVVGRVPLTSRQSIFLVKAGGRTLLIGAGPQGAPTLLGEFSEADRDEAGGQAPAPPAAAFEGHRLDVRLGDEG